MMTERFLDTAFHIGIFLLYTNIAVNFYTASGSRAMPVLVSLLFVVPFVLRVVFGRERARIDGVLCLLILFMACAMISSFVAKDIDVAIAWLFEFVTEGLLLYFLVSNLVRDAEAWRNVVATLLLAGTLMGSVVVIEVITESQVGTSIGLVQPHYAQEDMDARPGPHRTRGPTGDPNRFAQNMIILLPLSIFYFQTSKSTKQRILGASASVMCTAAVLLSYSRGGFLTLVLLLIAMALSGFVRPRYILASLLLAALLVPVAAPLLLQRMGTLRSIAGLFLEDRSVQVDSSARGRLTEMLAAFNVFVDHPVIGVGPGQYSRFYSISYQNNPQISFKELEKTRRAHTLYFELAAELGILGLLAFASILGFLLRNLWKVRRRRALDDPVLASMATAVVLSLFAYLVSGTFLHLAYQRYFWLLTAVAGTVLTLSRDTETVEAHESAEPLSADAPGVQP